MFNHETELRFHRLLLAIAKFEKNIEESKQMLANNIRFEPYAAFKRLDRDCNGYLTKEEILEFLR